MTSVAGVDPSVIRVAVVAVVSFGAGWGVAALIGRVLSMLAAREQLAAFARYREGADGAAVDLVAVPRRAGKTTPPAGRGSGGRVSVEPSHGVRSASGINLHQTRRVRQDG